MSLRYKGGVISATPPTTTGTASGTAIGVWTLQQQMQAQGQSVWPVSLPTVQIKVWGAGGGYGNFGTTSGENGGPGGYAEATFKVISGTTLTIFVGQGGGNSNIGGALNGGRGSPYGGTDAGKGGGFTGVFVGSYAWANLNSIASTNALIIAGSGGGGCYFQGGAGGGYGGGTTGGNGMNRVSDGTGSAGGNGSGGTATGGGTAGTGNEGSGTAGSLYTGGAADLTTNGGPGGGGGAGWYGGGGAGGTDSSNAGGGGGGSGMIASVTSGTSLPSGISLLNTSQFITQTGTATTAPNNSDVDYVAGKGTGGTSNPNTNGGEGYIVVYINGVKTTYSYTGNVATVTV